MRNRKNEANALGNLGNTLRSLNQFSEAADRCRAQLQIWRDLGQRQGEARALYNLGNIFHAQAKAIDGSSKAEGHRVGNFWNFEVVIVKNASPFDFSGSITVATEFLFGIFTIFEIGEIAIFV